ncbi:MAG: class I SAM-dependent methyltransferase [Anaerolineae bacterium]|nr:class I SAM-dependent methyltransferase [Anaerolineae bacterium]
MQTSDQAVKKKFGRAAARYAASTVHAHGGDLTHMVAIAELTGAEAVLDAGCGAGHTALAFAPNVERVVAYDMTPEMLDEVERLAKKRGAKNVVTQGGNVEALPFADGAFDLVVSRYSAHHWAHPLTALHEFHRVLKPRGRFILSDIVAPEAPLLDTWLQAIELLRDPSHVRDHTRKQWCDMLIAAGFDPQVMFGWMLPLEFDAWVKRIDTPPQLVDTLRALFDDAPAEVRAAFTIGLDYGFSIPGAVVMGRRI